MCESIYSLVIVHSDDDQPSCPEDQIVITPEGKEEYLEYEVFSFLLVVNFCSLCIVHYLRN